MIGKFRVNQSVLTKKSDHMSSESKRLSYTTTTTTDIDLNIFRAVNGDISAKSLADNLFPEKKPHVFISHSSKDVNMAIRFANSLYDKYGIVSFIDSQLWGHIDYALKEMHELYCKIPNSSSYYYSKSNNLLSHMHAILSMALMRVMDNADCVIFIESENSIHNYMEESEINPFNTIEKKSETLSPWISSEVSFANSLRVNGHQDRKLSERAGLESDSVNESIEKNANDSMPSIIHGIDLTNFIEVSDNGFCESMSLNRSTPIRSLDMIYRSYCKR